MSTASSALPGKPSFGGLLARIILIVLLWAALVTGTLHYVGYAWPKAYQISQAEKAEADEKAMNVLNPPTSAKPAAAASTATPAAVAPTGSSAAPTPATPVATASSGSSTSAATAPAAASAAASTPTATTSAPAAPAATSAPKAATGEQNLPFDIRLAGYNRTALGNVSIFFSIVISVFCVGSIILQIFKYKQTET